MARLIRGGRLSPVEGEGDSAVRDGERPEGEAVPGAGLDLLPQGAEPANPLPGQAAAALDLVEGHRDAGGEGAVELIAAAGIARARGRVDQATTRRCFLPSRSWTGEAIRRS